MYLLQEKDYQVINLISRVLLTSGLLFVWPSYGSLSCESSFSRFKIDLEVSISVVLEMRKAAGRGNIESQKMLASLYYKGDEFQQDFEQAFYWFQKAANQGDPDSQHMIAHMFSTGKGVQQDFKQAVYWFRQASRKGHVESQGRLAGMYYTGKGVQKDLKRAVYWFQKAADQGDPNSQHILFQIREIEREI